MSDVIAAVEAVVATTGSASGRSPWRRRSRGAITGRAAPSSATTSTSGRTGPAHRDQHQRRRRAPQHGARARAARVLRRGRGRVGAASSPRDARGGVPRDVPRRMAAAARRRAAAHASRSSTRPRRSTSTPSSCCSRSSSRAPASRALIVDPRALATSGGLCAREPRDRPRLQPPHRLLLRRAGDAPRCGPRMGAGDVVVTPNPHPTRSTPTSGISRCCRRRRLRAWGVPGRDDRGCSRPACRRRSRRSGTRDELWRERKR